VVLAAGQDAYGLALDDLYAYWTDDVAGTVNRVPLAGGPSIVLASGQQQPGAVVVDDRYVYWTNAATDGAVMRLAK
jgi:hypothetical protein